MQLKKEHGLDVHGKSPRQHKKIILLLYGSENGVV